MALLHTWTPPAASTSVVMPSSYRPILSSNLPVPSFADPVESLMEKLRVEGSSNIYERKSTPNHSASRHLDPVVDIILKPVVTDGVRANESYDTQKVTPSNLDGLPIQVEESRVCGAERRDDSTEVDSILGPSTPCSGNHDAPELRVGGSCGIQSEDCSVREVGYTAGPSLLKPRSRSASPPVSGPLTVSKIRSSELEIPAPDDDLSWLTPEQRLQYAPGQKGIISQAVERQKPSSRPSVASPIGDPQRSTCRPVTNRAGKRWRLCQTRCRHTRTKPARRGRSCRHKVKPAKGPPPIDREDDQWRARLIKLHKISQGVAWYRVAYEGFLHHSHDRWVTKDHVSDDLREPYDREHGLVSSILQYPPEMSGHRRFGADLSVFLD